MEEWVGARWHRFIWQAADSSFPKAAVRLEDVQRAVQMLFRAGGGDALVRVVPATAQKIGGPRNWLQKVAGMADHRMANEAEILDHLGADFVGVDVLQSEPLREGIKTFTDWPTIPQLYVKGEFVGGADIIREMFQSGELKTFLAEQGVLAA